MWNVWLLTSSQALDIKKKDKVQVPQRNEMLSLYCTTLGFIGKMIFIKNNIVLIITIIIIIIINIRIRIIRI